jgi:hypothetical protein
MSIQLQTAEETSAASAEIVKLESVVEAVRCALNAFEKSQATLPAQYRRESTELKNTLTAAQRTLNIARTNQHNANVYQSVLGDIQSNMATNAAEKAALASQAAQESEAQFKVRAESAYIEAGGTVSGFIGEWPGLRAELVRQKTLAALGAQAPNFVDEYIQRRNGA